MDTSGLVTGVWHCCLGSTGRVAVALLKASKGPEALVAFRVTEPGVMNDQAAPAAAAMDKAAARAACQATVTSVVVWWAVDTLQDGTLQHMPHAQLQPARLACAKPDLAGSLHLC
jgi:hypothetical protein